ncbi:MAG TPA: hypothetical protein VGK25_11380 [Ignavibacteria bacterium]
MKLIIVFAAGFFVASTMAQSVNLRFNTYVYGWQRIDSLSDESSAKTTHIRGYQNLLFEISGGKWSFNTIAQTEEDLANKVGDGFNYRLYNAYIRGSNLFNMLDLKLGRQFVYAGVGKGTLDGLYLKLKAGKNKQYQLAVYGGSIVPYTYDFKDYPEIKNNYMAGAQFSYYGVKDLMVGVSYILKRTAPPSYSANRMDSTFTTSLREITFDGPATQLVGFDFNYTYKVKHNFYGKAYYDITQKKFYRGEFNARLTVMDNLRFSAGYIYSRPQLSFNSIFWVFGQTKQNQEIEGGLDYTIKNGMNFYGRVGVALFESDDAATGKNNSIKIQAGMVHPMYGLSFVRYMGYTGESDGVFGYYQRQLMKDKLSTSLSLSYSRYKLGDYETDKVNSLAGALGFTFRPTPQFSIDAQGQMLVNRIYKTDVRFLVGFNYWLFKNFSRRDG